jgi:hypothetical protein
MNQFSHVVAPVGHKKPTAQEGGLDNSGFFLQGRIVEETSPWMLL